MGMSAAHTDWTIDLLDALPDDGQRYEIVDGELFVTPSPGESHQDLVLALAARLHAYLHGSAVGKAMISPSDVRRGDHTRNRVQPDVYVIRRIGGARPEYPCELHNLLFAAEVVSPANPRYDYVTKRDLYMKENVGEYWVIDPIKRTITRWRGLNELPDVRRDTIAWQPDGMPEPFVLDVQQYFADAFA